jgi:hypothetical protein
MNVKRGKAKIIQYMLWKSEKKADEMLMLFANPYMSP